MQSIQNSSSTFILIGLVLIAGIGCEASIHTENRQDKNIMNEVSGSFEVTITPTDTGDDQLRMMLLSKKYEGDLDATGTGRMLTGMTEIPGSAGYVAIERIDGTLKGAKGSFLIQHSGISVGEEKRLVIQVIPDSGTQELAGIVGTMEIKLEGGKHFYRFEYDLKSD